MQADQVGAVLRQLAAGQGLFEGFFQAVELHLGFTVDPHAIEEVLDGPRAIARHHFHQVTRQPAAGGRRLEAQQVHRRATAVRVEQFTTQQGPVVVAGRLPGIHGGLAGQQAQLLLPVTQGVRVAAVDLHRGEQGLCAMFAQPGVQAFGETAEVLVLPVAEAQHRVIQASQARCPAQYLALETAGAVRCFAVAEGADHEQGIVRITQVLLADVRQRLHFYRQACGLQLPGGLPRQLLGKTTLAGEADQPRRRIAGGLHEAFAGILDLAFSCADDPGTASSR